MNIDMTALHAIEIDRGISVDELLDTIKSALLTAYRHTEVISPTPASISTAKAVSCK